MKKVNELNYPLANKDQLLSYQGEVGWKGKIVWMEPDKFLRLAAPLTYPNLDGLKDLKDKMLKSKPLDFLVLHVDMEKKKVIGHEGRHRATVAKELGIEKVPVLIYTGSGFKRVPKWDDQDHADVEKADFKPEKSINEDVDLSKIRWEKPIATSPREVPLKIDVFKVDKSWSKDKDFYIGPGGTGAPKRGCYQGFISYLQRGEPIGLPQISFGEWSQCIQFTNGRHRFAVLRDMGLKKIPAMVPKEQLEFFKKNFV